jgi:crotonobetainyl-CoA:carnitine CoA-transferase CaiB-like acyl-CoA transferase
MSPLEGTVVVAIEQAVSAPYCTRQLADLGARVIKVESVNGDFARHYDDVVHGLSAHFAWANRGKESVQLDVKAAEDREALEALLAGADVLVQNLAPAAAESLGVDARSAVSRHERLVAVDISGYGRGGPLSSVKAYDLLVQAEAGSCAITGTPQQRAKPGIPVADIGAGVHAANAVLAALLMRTRTGRGAAISVSLFDVVTDWTGWALNQARFTGAGPIPNGLSSPMVAPYGAYPTSDEQTILFGTTNDQEWQRLSRKMLGRADLAADERYASNSGRVARRAELDAAIAAWTSERSFDEAAHAAAAAGLGYARLNTSVDVLTHPQLLERDRWRQTRGPGGSFPSLRPPADIDGCSWEPGAVPALGEHTEQVLGEFRRAAVGRSR